MSTVVTGPKTALHPTTGIAGAAIVKHRAVKRGADANTYILGTANSINVGIAADDQDTAGRTFAYGHRPGELVTVEAGAAFALDAFLTSDANGRLVTATTGQNVCAVAREASTALSQLVTAEIRYQLAP